MKTHSILKTAKMKRVSVAGKTFYVIVIFSLFSISGVFSPPKLDAVIHFRSGLMLFLMAVCVIPIIRKQFILQ